MIPLCRQRRPQLEGHLFEDGTTEMRSILDQRTWLERRESGPNRDLAWDVLIVVDTASR